MPKQWKDKPKIWRKHSQEVVASTFSLSAWEIGALRFLWVQGQPELHIETALKKQAKQNQIKQQKSNNNKRIKNFLLHSMKVHDYNPSTRKSERIQGPPGL